MTKQEKVDNPYFMKTHFGTRSFRFTIVCCISALWLLNAFAHPPFPSYIQHEIAVSLSNRYADITIELTFHQSVAMEQRQRMDADKSGTLSHEEIQTYLESNEAVFVQSFTLRSGSKALELLPLYQPEVDLLNDERVSPSPFGLTLYLFASFPDDERNLSSFILDDVLFPDTPAIISWAATGIDGKSITDKKEKQPIVSERIDSVSRSLRIGASGLQPSGTGERKSQTWYFAILLLCGGVVFIMLYRFRNRG